MTHKPTDETRDLVGKLVIAGCSQEKIAFYLDITDDTLRKHYARELQVPLIDATEVLSSSLYQSAVNGDKEDRRFWLTHRGGWYKAVPPVVVKLDDERSKQFLEFIKDRKAEIEGLQGKKDDLGSESGTQ